MKHRYIKHQNCEIERCIVCDGGLSICDVCGLSEGALTDDCPSVTVPHSAANASYAGRLNFREGMWREEPNTLGWADARVRPKMPDADSPKSIGWGRGMFIAGAAAGITPAHRHAVADDVSNMMTEIRKAEASHDEAMHEWRDANDGKWRD